MKYRLSISGEVEYEKDGRDDRTRLLLLAATSTLMPSDSRFKVAVQELKEESKDIRISMEEIKRDEDEE